jgi:hypothetical protein
VNERSMVLLRYWIVSKIMNRWESWSHPSQTKLTGLNSLKLNTVYQCNFKVQWKTIYFKVQWKTIYIVSRVIYNFTMKVGRINSSKTFFFKFQYNLWKACSTESRVWILPNLCYLSFSFNPICVNVLLTTYLSPLFVQTAQETLNSFMWGSCPAS